jgi:hypothetical protein
MLLRELQKYFSGYPILWIRIEPVAIRIQDLKVQFGV